MDPRREKILIMVGEEAARLSLQELLQASGYEVLVSDACEDSVVTWRIRSSVFCN